MYMFQISDVLIAGRVCDYTDVFPFIYK